MGKPAKDLRPSGRGSIVVSLERTTLQPGDTLVGTVRLALTKPIVAATLKLRAHGTQGLNWMAPSCDSIVPYSRSIDHWVHEIDLVREGKSFDVGERDYPFTIKLPQDLQHNFAYSCSNAAELQGVRVHVEHIVTASLFVNGESIANLLQGQATFQVHPLPSAVPPGYSVAAVRSEDVKLFSMITKGQCDVAFKIATDVFDFSSTIEAVVSLCLETTRKLKYVSLALYEEGHVNRHDPVFKAIKTGRRLVCCRRMDSESIQWLTAADGPEATSNKDSIAAKTTHFRMALPITPNDLSDFELLNPTMESFFLDVNYRVFVKCKLSMAKSVNVDVPITIVRKLVEPTATESSSPLAA